VETVNAVYSTDPGYTYVVPSVLREPDTEYSMGFRLPQPPTADWRKRVLDALGTSVRQLSGQTFSYRRTGEDTLNWGDPDDWVRIVWSVQCLSEGIFRPACVEQYGILRDIRRVARLRELEEMYSFRDRTAVRRFLQAHLSLIDFILEARFYVSEVFGPDTEVELEVFSDPEVEGQEQLFANILTSLPVDEALGGLEKLDVEWFLDQLDRVDGRFNLDLVFI
jgi:hypothetical protein